MSTHPLGASGASPSANKDPIPFARIFLAAVVMSVLIMRDRHREHLELFRLSAPVVAKARRPSQRCHGSPVLKVVRCLQPRVGMV